jgi:hypothetical protein
MDHVEVATPSAPRRSAPRRSATKSLRQIVTWALLVAVVVFAVAALRHSWSQVRHSFGVLRPVDLVCAEGLALVSAWAMYRSWRTVLGGLAGTVVSGHDTRAIYFCSQVGKYVPGTVWPAVIQADLGSRARLSRTVVLSSYAMALMASVGFGGLVAAGTLTGHRRPWVTLAVVGAIVGGLLLCAVFVHPGGPQGWLRRVLARRRPGLELGAIATTTAGEVFTWSLLGWSALGLHTWFLARSFGAHGGDVVFVTGAMALAWTAGIAAVPLPAGAGLREAILVATLGHRIGSGPAISVALLSRLAFLVDDVVLAVAMGLPRVWRQARRRRAPGAPSRP